jgi:hypothetical protein
MPERVYTLSFTAEELDLLAEALDSHKYWQLSDKDRRDSGFVREPLTDEERECDRLEDRIRAELKEPPEPADPLGDPPADLADAWERFQHGGGDVTASELRALDEWRASRAEEDGY